MRDALLDLPNPLIGTRPFQVSIDTVIGASALLGHRLDDRARVRAGHDLDLWERLRDPTATPLRDPAQRELFTCAPVDVLVERDAAGCRFHIAELNGTGIGGVGNLPESIVAELLVSLRETASRVPHGDGVVLLGISGKESPTAPRLNHCMHEKLLFAEALQRGLADRWGAARITCVPAIDGKTPLPADRPTVVLGYMKELIDELQVDGDGRLCFGGRPVRGILNDRFCLNVLDHFGVSPSLDDFLPMNACFVAGSSKGLAYEMVDRTLGTLGPDPCLPPASSFELAANRRELVRIVSAWLHTGRRAVIKPHATGIGHGIEFFLDPNEDRRGVLERIDRSIESTAELYHMPGGAFPYTVCDFIDTARVEQPGHPLRGHKFEIRVVVFRSGDRLLAFPSTAKIASKAFDPDNPDRMALINNITASSAATKKGGADFSLPLCSADTLATLGVTERELAKLASLCTAVVRRTLDDVSDHPGRHGLLPRRAQAPHATT